MVVQLIVLVAPEVLGKEIPLSPLFFVIVTKALSIMISSMVKNGGYLAGFSVGDISRGTLSISHLLFTDNTLIFCEVDHNQIWAPRHCYSTLRLYLG